MPLRSELPSRPRLPRLRERTDDDPLVQRGEDLVDPGARPHRKERRLLQRGSVAHEALPRLRLDPRPNVPGPVRPPERREGPESPAALARGSLQPSTKTLAPHADSRQRGHDSLELSFKPSS